MLFLIFKVAIQIIAVALAILVNYLDYLWSDKRTRRFKSVRRTLFVLSFVFLLGSVIATVIDQYSKQQEARRAIEKETALNNQLVKVQEQNDGLQKGIAVLSAKSTGILDEQRNSFISVLDSQRQSVLQTTDKIEGSGLILHRRLNDSIKLLQLSEREIERAGNPIKDVTVSLIADIEMKDPSLASYRTRLETGVAERLNLDKAKWLNYRTVETGLEVVMVNVGTGLATVVISNGSPLLPDAMKEKAAFDYLNYVLIDLDIYRKPLTPEQIEDTYSAFLGIRDVTYDLSMPVRLTLAPQYDFARPVLELEYDMQSGRYGVIALDVPVSPANQFRNNKITSIPDLRGSQMIITFAARNAELREFSIKMSGGISFSFDIGKDCKRYSTGLGDVLKTSKRYACNFPE